MGQYYRKGHAQSRGALQGGVLSPPLWLLLVNGVPDKVENKLKMQAPYLDVEEDCLLQIFADDISEMIKGQDEIQVIQRAGISADILRETLAK